MRNTLEMATARLVLAGTSRSHATPDVVAANHPVAVIGAAFAVFLMLTIASVGSLVVRFFAGLAAILGCMGLLIVILALLLLYRVMENPLANLALLIGAGTWAWWYTVRKRREEHALRTGAPARAALAPLARRIYAWLTPPSSRPMLASRSLQDAPPLPAHPAAPRTRQRSESVASALDHRRRRRTRPHRD